MLDSRTAVNFFLHPCMAVLTEIPPASLCRTHAQYTHLFLLLACCLSVYQVKTNYPKKLGKASWLPVTQEASLISLPASQSQGGHRWDRISYARVASHAQSPCNETTVLAAGHHNGAHSVIRRHVSWRILCCRPFSDYIRQRCLHGTM